MDCEKCLGDRSSAFVDQPGARREVQRQVPGFDVREEASNEGFEDVAALAPESADGPIRRRMGHNLGQKRGGLRSWPMVVWPVSCVGRSVGRTPLSQSRSASQWIAATTFRVRNGNARRARSNVASTSGIRLADSVAMRTGPSLSRAVIEIATRSFGGAVRTHSSCSYRGTVTRTGIWCFPGAQGRLRQRQPG